MKLRRRAAIVLGGLLLISLGIASAVFLQTTYSEQQLLLAGEKYLIQQGESINTCELLKKSWYNESLVCLYQTKEVQFVIGFAKNPLFPQRLTPFFQYYPPKEERENGENSLFEFSSRNKNLYTYVVFGKRPQNACEIEVEVLEKDNSRRNQFHHKLGKEENVLYVLQKQEEDLLQFQYILID